MKRGRTFTTPALLAGLRTLLAMREMLKTHSLDELRAPAAVALAAPARPP